MKDPLDFTSMGTSYGATSLSDQKAIYRDPDTMSDAEIRKLVHDLSVHQIELEMQNEQLRKSQEELQISKSRFYQLFNSIPVGYVALDTQGIIQEFNERFLELCEINPLKTIGRSLISLIGDTDRLAYSAWIKAGNKRAPFLTVSFKTPKNELLFVNLTASSILDDQGDDFLTAVACVDVTALKVAEDRIRLSAAVFESATEGTMITNADQRIIMVNPAFTRITGYSAKDVIGKTPKLLKSGKHDSFFYQEFWQSLHKNQHWEGEIWNQRKNGEIYPERLSINVLNNYLGHSVAYIAIFNDVTSQKKAQDIIRQQATHDVLTGLPNRLLFIDRLEKSMYKAAANEISTFLMFLDLDGFKEVNDTLGHNAGDTLLKETALRLQSCVRGSDTVARLGGDEFAIILHNQENFDGVDRIADCILNSVAQPYLIGSDTVYITVSIGITNYHGSGKTVEELIKNADQAMYAAKNEGKNRISIFSEDMQQSMNLRHKIVSDLRAANIAEEFVVFYQPIVHLHTGEIHKAEALVRWNHPKDGILPPGSFIQIAEETSRIIEIGEHVFLESVRQLQNWRKQFNPKFKISINVSPVQFRNKRANLTSWVVKIKDAGLEPDCIVAEITESLLLDHNDTVDSNLLGFQESGIEVALDDFGTGYSSMAYLKKFDIDYIKIDQSFVRNLSINFNDKVLCEAMIVMAQKLGMKVIAEGIETEDQMRLLREMGCDYGQGYLLSKPLPAPDFEKFLTDFYNR